MVDSQKNDVISLQLIICKLSKFYNKLSIEKRHEIFKIYFLVIEMNTVQGAIYSKTKLQLNLFTFL